MVELVDTIDLESILYCRGEGSSPSFDICVISSMVERLVYTEIVRGSSPLSLNEEFKVKFKFFKTRLFYKKFMDFL